MQTQQPLAHIFRFLAQAMRYPDPAWFTNDFLTAYNGLLSALEWPTRENFPTTVSATLLEEIQVEYTRLFINAVPHVIAPPYASVFMNGSLNGNWADATLKFYQQHGYGQTDKEFPDYLITELDFMALLEEENQGSSGKFQEKLFRPWFTIFQAKVLDNSQDIYLTTTIELIDFFTSPDD